MEVHEFIKNLIDQADEMVDFLSAHRKSEREKSVCAAFLRALGISFVESELKPVESDTPDVDFGEAHFEVVEVLDPGRKRHAEWKHEAKRRRRARTVEDLTFPYRPPLTLTQAAVVAFLADFLSKAKGDYSPSTRAGLDLVVYLNLKKAYLDVNSPSSDMAILVSQGWRSLSLLAPPYAHVLVASPLAPEFLRRVVCQKMCAWYDPDTLFQLNASTAHNH